MKIARADGTKSAKVIQVIETKAKRGLGTEKDPVREVTQYWDLDGFFLAEMDPNHCVPIVLYETEAVKESVSAEAERSVTVENGSLFSHIVLLDGMLKGLCSGEEDEGLELLKKRALFVAIQKLVEDLDDQDKERYKEYLKVIVTTEESWDRVTGMLQEKYNARAQY